MLRQQQQQWQVPIVELNVDCLPAISLIHKTFETDGKWNWNCRRTYSFILNVLLCMSKRAKANQNQTKSIRFKVRSSPFNCIFKSLKCFETVLELIQEYSRHKNLGDIILQFNCSFFLRRKRIIETWPKLSETAPTMISNQHRIGSEMAASAVSFWGDS